jgi:hypothetical protein
LLLNAADFQLIAFKDLSMEAEWLESDDEYTPLSIAIPNNPPPPPGTSRKLSRRGDWTAGWRCHCISIKYTEVPFSSPGTTRFSEK